MTPDDWDSYDICSWCCVIAVVLVMALGGVPQYCTWWFIVNLIDTICIFTPLFPIYAT